MAAAVSNAAGRRTPTRPRLACCLAARARARMWAHAQVPLRKEATLRMTNLHGVGWVGGV